MPLSIGPPHYDPIDAQALDVNPVEHAATNKIDISKWNRFSEQFSNFFRRLFSCFGVETFQTKLANALEARDNAKVVTLIKSGLSVKDDLSTHNDVSKFVSTNAIGVKILMKQGLGEETRINVLEKARRIIDTGIENKHDPLLPQKKRNAIEVVLHRLEIANEYPLTHQELEIISELYFYNEEFRDSDIFKNKGLEDFLLNPQFREKMAFKAMSIILLEDHSQDFAMDFLEERLKLKNRIPLTRSEADFIGRVYSRYLECENGFKNSANKMGLQDQHLGSNRQERMSKLLGDESLVYNFALADWLRDYDLKGTTIPSERGGKPTVRLEYFDVVSRLLSKSIPDEETLRPISKQFDALSDRFSYNSRNKWLVRNSEETQQKVNEIREALKWFVEPDFS